MIKGLNPPPSPLAPLDRYYPATSGRPTTSSGLAPGLVVAARTPGTPRREKSSHANNGGRDSSALQDPGLKDYRLGECLGKGAFGSVYKAFNWGTGEAVAVKQIKTADLPPSELRMIESEIELLKNLHHDNIVKYIGFVRSADSLNIILEYCENGSLHSICKAYGKFPENLVGVYMTQVLNGLHYLHDQGVIHRDIKGANILTTKDGTVKLADFGVSTSTLAGGQDNAQVVGTPYWMAPEIIQLSGASAASDIWSVGCTVIELLQGKPPYHNLAAMPALFAIVNDDHPPLPEGISAAARDFLMQCFQKDPNLRVNARKLLRHAWIVGCRRSDAPLSKTPSNLEAVEEVKQWNKALKSSERSLRASTGSDSGHPMLHGFAASRYGQRGPLALVQKPRPTTDAFRSPELADDDNWDNDFATAISPSALQLPHLKPQDNFGGLLSADRLKAFASGSEHRNGMAHQEEYFDGESLTIRGPRDDDDDDDVDPLEQTIRPISRKGDKETKRQETARMQIITKINGTKPGPPSAGLMPKSPSKSHFGAKFELPPRIDVVYREESNEDFSDLFVDNDNVFKRGLHLMPRKVKLRKPTPMEEEADTPPAQASRQSDASSQLSSPQLFHPSDLTNLPRSTHSPTGTGSGLRRQAAPRPTVLPDRPVPRPRSLIEIQKFAENEEDEDFSDVFGPDDSATEREESDRGSEVGGDGALMLMSKMSGSSWFGDDDDEHDPFASMDPGWDEMDLEANIARDRHARLCEKVEELVRSLKITGGDEKLSDLAETTLSLLYEHSEVKNLIISAHGLLPLLEILESCNIKTRQLMILNLLKVVNMIILDDVEIQENLCFVGGIPIITKFAARQYSNEIRLQAAAFVRQMYQTSTLTLQMFVSAGGLSVLVEFLDEDYDVSRDLVLIGVNGIWNVFELQTATPKNDFCRIFSRSKILYPLALTLHRVLDEDGEDELGELIEGRIVNIFFLFSQAENHVKEVVADRQVLKSVLKDLRRMTPVHQITMLKFIKNLSMLSTTLESLHSADAIEFLIDVLSYSMKKGQKHFREISNQVLNTMFNLCRLSKERQVDAAVGGIIPLLLKIMKTDRPPKEFALPILCDMAHSGSKGRRYLWQNKGLEFYVSLLADQYWQVTALDAILVWLQEETANVESHLLECNFSSAITSCFDTSRLNAFDSNLLEPLLKLLRLGPALAATLAKPEMFSGIAQRLGHKNPAVRLNLLKLVRAVLDACDPAVVAAGNGPSELDVAQGKNLMQAIQVLAERDSAVLVRNLAFELVRSHIDGAQGNQDNSLLVMSGLGSVSSTASSSRCGTGTGPRRRNPSYTPPSLLPPSSSSLPPTPTHHPVLHRSSNSALSSLGGMAFIEVAATPRRPTTAQTHDRESSLYRPRSREGSTGLPRRISGDSASSTTMNALAGNPPSSAKLSRLPRNSTPFSRPGSTTPQGPGAVAAALRSESVVSHHKENGSMVGAAGSRGYRSGSGSGSSRSGSGGSASMTGSAGSTNSVGSATSTNSGNKRRRPVSSDIKVPPSLASQSLSQPTHQLQGSVRSGVGP